MPDSAILAGTGERRGAAVPMDPPAAMPSVRPDPELAALAARLSPVHLRQRLNMEGAHGKAVFGYGRTFFHLENWYSIHALIRGVLKLGGLYGRGLRNALAIAVTRHEARLPALPAAFDGLRVLQLSDLHLDASEAFVHALAERVRGVEADLTVLTGDFRYRTHGDWRPALERLERLRPQLPGEVYAILGNHDTVRMVPRIESLDIRLLMNEHVTLTRADARLHLAGIDDPHFFEAGNIERAADGIPAEDCAILLSHSPETWWQAAHAGFDLLLAGHTHGGQVCLPGGLPLMLNADCPRAYCRGPWRYRDMLGYTSTGAGSSIVGVRYNCPPEIVVHTLRRG